MRDHYVLTRRLLAEVPGAGPGLPGAAGWPLVWLSVAPSDEEVAAVGAGEGRRGCGRSMPSTLSSHGELVRYAPLATLCRYHHPLALVCARDPALRPTFRGPAPCPPPPRRRRAGGAHEPGGGARGEAAGAAGGARHPGEGRDGAEGGQGGK